MLFILGTVALEVYWRGAAVAAAATSSAAAAAADCSAIRHRTAKVEFTLYGDELWRPDCHK